MQTIRHTDSGADTVAQGDDEKADRIEQNMFLIGERR